MKSILLTLSLIVAGNCFSQKPATSAKTPDEIMPVRGFCIAAPAPGSVDRFVKFIDEELAPR